VTAVEAAWTPSIHVLAVVPSGAEEASTIAAPLENDVGRGRVD